MNGGAARVRYGDLRATCVGLRCDWVKRGARSRDGGMPWRHVCGANGKTEGTSWRMSVMVGGMRSRLMDGRREGDVERGLRTLTKAGPLSS